jgi:hypothetical protein
MREKAEYHERQQQGTEDTSTREGCSDGAHAPDNTLHKSALST